MSDEIQRNQVQQPPPYHPYSYPPPGYGPGEEEINLFELWGVLMEKKWLIAGITSAVTVLAVIYALLATPVYRAETLLAPVKGESRGRMSELMSQYGGLAAMAGIDLSSKLGKNEALAILQSRRFLGDFIHEENLMPVLFADNWNAEKGSRTVKKENIPTESDAVGAFKGILSVSEDRKTGLVTVGVEWKDPVLVAEWANRLVSRVNREIREKTIEKSRKSIDYLEKQLQQTNSAENRQMIYSLIQSDIKNLMLADITDEVAFKVIDPAVVPKNRSEPQRKKIVLIGMMLGLAGSIFIVFARRFLKNQRKSNEEKAAPPSV